MKFYNRMPVNVTTAQPSKKMLSIIEKGNSDFQRSLVYFQLFFHYDSTVVCVFEIQTNSRPVQSTDLLFSPFVPYHNKILPMLQ